jgi:hypothetical protein
MREIPVYLKTVEQRPGVYVTLLVTKGGTALSNQHTVIIHHEVGELVRAEVTFVFDPTKAYLREDDMKQAVKDIRSQTGVSVEDFFVTNEEKQEFSYNEQKTVFGPRI